MVDADGYRANAGIILANEAGKVFWARRVGQDSWQFPQGGIRAAESPEQAMFRELREETGLCPEHVEVMGATRDWLRYDLPRRYIRRKQKPQCIGQKQIWFLLKMIGDDNCVTLNACDHPEFDHWCWVDHWTPSEQVIFFKRRVYEQALRELVPLLSPQHRSTNRAGTRQAAPPPPVPALEPR